MANNNGNVTAFREGSKRYVPSVLDNMRLVYDVLKQHSVGGQCRLSVRDIAEICGLTHTAVHRILQRLKAEGLIQVEPGRYVNEPDTIIVNPSGYSDVVLEVMATLQKMAQDINYVNAFLPALVKQQVEAGEGSALFNDFLQAVIAVNELPGFLNVVVDTSKLPDTIKARLLSSSGGPPRSAE